MSSEGPQPEPETKVSARDISIMNVAICATQNRSGELGMEIDRALRNSITPDDIRAILDEVVLRIGDRGSPLPKRNPSAWANQGSKVARG